MKYSESEKVRLQPRLPCEVKALHSDYANKFAPTVHFLT